MNYKVLQCGHCGTSNAVATCAKCGRYFIITASHAGGIARTFESALAEFPMKAIETCDFCSTQEAQNSPAQAVNAGLQQQTCASCHTSFSLSMDFGKREPANKAHALDAAMTILFHIEAHRRRASEAIRSTH